MSRCSSTPLTAVNVLITRPVGQGRTLARQVRALGGRPVLLPGVSLCAVPGATPVDLRAALQSDLAVFTSPAAVRFAARLAPLHGRARMAAVGAGTARALARHGVTDVVVPRTTQNSEGLLAHAALDDMQGRAVAVIGAPGGRGTLQQVLRQRGAGVRDVHVYRRVPARLDRRHREAVSGLHGEVYMLLSSAETLNCLRAALDDAGWQRIVAARTVVSSERLRVAAHQAGFKQVKVAASALGADLLACAAQWHAAG
ncbi:MAG TPA: uroporphyrinogen-III synthase [Oleiagrimonas sp.]|nr:uroporphyrinogen-III synthase [Oleiagrimonas sp.]